MDFKKSFCWPSNLSNDYVIYTFVNMYVVFVTNSRSGNGYGFWRPGVKTGVVNDIFWSETGSEFEELGGTPHQEFPGVLAGLYRGCQIKLNIFYLFILSQRNNQHGFQQNFICIHQGDNKFCSSVSSSCGCRIPRIKKQVR